VLPEPLKGGNAAQRRAHALLELLRSRRIPRSPSRMTTGGYRTRLR
jgi:hypothetical protein